MTIERFCNRDPNQTLLDTEMFKEYRHAFDSSSEVKKLKEQKSFQKKSEDEQQAELNRRFIQFAREIEREKLYYFILAYTQPCPVIVVRSPQNTEERKKFLGYEWSAAKGQRVSSICMARLTASKPHSSTRKSPITRRKSAHSSAGILKDKLLASPNRSSHMRPLPVW